MRVDSRDLPLGDWHHYLRVRDLLQLMSVPPVPLRGPVLEIGSGDGVLTEHLERTLGDVVPTDVRPRKEGAVVCLADAQCLPFKSGHFKLVFSSNVLEHVPDLHTCLAELHRVTTPDAIMLHTMPTPIWKLLQFAALPAGLFAKSILPRFLGRPAEQAFPDGREDASGGEALSSGSVSSRLRRALWPPVHGISSSHLGEIAAFRVSRWSRMFSGNGFDVIRTDPLFLHSPYRIAPYRWLKVRDMLGRAGLSSVYAYWLRKL